jgi:uncharacterized protein (TIGR03435 family)
MAASDRHEFKIMIRSSAALGLLASLTIYAQAPARPQFEVVSIKPHDPAVTAGGLKETPNGINYSRVTLYQCITTAYRVSAFQISGKASEDRAVMGERYDILATADHAVTKDERRLMLQALLSDRFGLQLHREQKEMAVLALAADGKRLKLDRTEGGESSVKIVPSGVSFRNTSMQGFADFLSRLSSIQRPVLDRTSLDGDFNFILSQSDSQPGDAGPDKRTVSDWPSIFADLHDLGLRLEPARAPVEMLMIDHAEKPSAN